MLKGRNKRKRVEVRGRGSRLVAIFGLVMPFLSSYWHHCMSTDALGPPVADIEWERHNVTDCEKTKKKREDNLQDHNSTLGDHFP